MQALLLVPLAGLFAAAAWANDGRPQLEIVTLSNRADLISGGDALVEVRVPRDVSLSRVRVKLNDKDITASFKANAAARTLRGLVTGLVEGRIGQSTARGNDPCRPSSGSELVGIPRFELAPPRKATPCSRRSFRAGIPAKEKRHPLGEQLAQRGRAPPSACARRVPNCDLARPNGPSARRALLNEFLGTRALLRPTARASATL